MALEFEDVSTDRIYDDLVSSISYPFTMSCMGWFDSTGGTLISIGEVSGTRYHAIRKISGNASFITFDGGSFQATITAPSTNQWDHYCAVGTNSTSRQVYLNGTAGTADTNSHATITRDRVSLGVTADSTPFDDHNGRVAEAGIWDVALTTSEITALSKGVSPLLIRPQSLVYYRRGIRGDDGQLISGTTTPSSFGTPLNVPHPKVIYPSAQILSFGAAGGAGVTGTLARTLDNASVVSAGNVAIQGSLSRTLDTLSSVSAGNVLVQGALARTLDDASLASVGAVGSGITGSLTRTLDDSSVVSDGTVLVQGALGRSLDDAALASTGTIGSFIAGILSRTLDDAGLVSAGSVEVQGALARTLDDVSAVSAGTVEVQGALARTLEAMSLNSFGGEARLGDVDVTLGSLALASSGAAVTRRLSFFAGDPQGGGSNTGFYNPSNNGSSSDSGGFYN